jgi:DNA-binding transcriptional LysR family regulator
MYDWAEFRHFLYLLTILEKGGFRAAAEELHTSQPNLTVQARRFQDQASIRLFRKLKNGQISPTDTGVAFVSMARLILEIREEAIEALADIERGESRLVRLGSTPLVDPNLFRTFCTLHKQLLPRTTVRPTHADAGQLAQEVLDGATHAAIVTLPLSHPDLHIEELRRDKVVVCLRKDHPFAVKAELAVGDLQDNLTVIYHPHRHPEAHYRLLERLSNAGIALGEYSCASHPSEMQSLVKEGHGLALIREGTLLDEGLTTRRLSGADWTMDTAAIYHKMRRPKSVPILVKMLKRSIERKPLGSTASAAPRFAISVAGNPTGAATGARKRLAV